MICRKRLDEERGNPWICACPICGEERVAEDEIRKEDPGQRADSLIRSIAGEGEGQEGLKDA
jgi:hypothetical protein